MQFPSLKVDADEIARSTGSPRHCQHSRQEVRKKIDVNGRARLQNQCLDCGAPVGRRLSAKTYTPSQIETLTIFDEELRSSYWRAYSIRFEAARQEQIDRLKKRWRQVYDEYRRTPEWIARRNLVLLRAQGICEGCRSKRATEAHHTTYAHVGEEFLFELVAVCRTCHDRFHASVFPRFLETLYYAGYGRNDGATDINNEAVF